MIHALTPFYVWVIMLLSCYEAHQITPHANPLQGQGQTSANFSASLELTLRDIRSS
jgi:hypothetical protein